MANDIREEIYFGGGLDTDSDERFIVQGDYTDAQNLIKVEDGENGVLVNIKGNENVYQTTGLKYDENLCGWAYYENNNSVIMFIRGYSAQTFIETNKIVEFNPQSGKSTEIINDLDLGFENPVTQDYFVDVDILGDWLAWTDNINPPRLVNIQDIKDNNPTINATYLDLHKVPPVASSSIRHHPPAVSFGYDSSKVYNNLTTGYQFKYRYVYDDFRSSTWSRGSDIALSTDLSRSQDGAVPLNSNNYVIVKFDSGNVNVRYVDIAVREGNVGNWFRIIKIDKDDPEKVYDSTNTTLQTSALSDSTQYVFRFYNNEGRTAVSNTEVNKAYDTIPDTCEALSFIADNRLTLGGCVEGKDPVEITVSLTAQYNNPDLLDDWTPSYTRGSSFIITFDWDDIFSGGRTIANAGDYVYWDFDGVENHSGGTPLTYALQEYVVFDKTYTSVGAILTYLAANTSNPSESGYTAGDWSVQVGVGNTIEFTYEPPSGTFTGAASSNNSTIVYNSAYSYQTAYGYINDLSFKRSTTHKLALIYEDKYGRKYPALTSSTTDVEMEHVADSSAGIASIQYQITGNAPSDAVAYRWAYAYKPKLFLQTFITDERKIEDAEGNAKTDLIALDISANNQFTPDNYTPQTGDRMRIIREGNGYGTASGSYVSDAPEFIIEDYVTSITESTGSTDITGKWLLVKPSNTTGYSYSDIEDPSKFTNALVEIYHPQTEDTDFIFYEIGNGGYCVGGTNNHDDWHTGNSTGYLNQGDVWFRPVTRFLRSGSGRTAITLIIDFVEEPYPYVNAPRGDVGIADPNVAYPESQNKYDNIVRWSNKFFQDTQVNGLSTFDFDNKVDVADHYGRIQGLEELGNSLVMICEEKVLSSFIGATEYTDAQGNVNVVKTTRALGYVRPHAENYGTFLKESIINTGRYIYFYDIFNGVVVRKSYNGLFPISGRISSPQGSYDYKMRTFFKSLSEDLLDSMYYGSVSTPALEDVKCYMGFDPYYENVYITFVDQVNSANNISLIFHEPSNRWISKYTSYVTNESSRMWAFTKKNLFSFYNNTLYKHNSDTVNRCNLYGVAQSSYIKFVTHANPNIIKVFNSIGIHSNKAWVVDPIEAPINLNYTNGFYSKIPASYFENEEGVRRSNFLRNMKTRTSTATNFDLITGEELRSYLLEITMTNSDTTQVELFKADVSSEASQ
jgi:hypothetical protein